MMNERSFEEELQTAIEKEKLQFETFYRWLEKNFSQTFFNELSAEWISLIVHALMGFKVQDFFSEIHLKEGAIVLALDAPDADIRILQKFPLYGIKSYTTHISTKPFPTITSLLRIALIHYTNAEEEHDLVPNIEVSNLLKVRHPEWSEEKCHSLILAQDPSFLRTMSLEKKILALEMFEKAETNDHCQLEVQHKERSLDLVMAWKNTPKYHFLYQLAHLIYNHHLVMREVYASYVRHQRGDTILMLSFSLEGQKTQLPWEATDVDDLLQEILTLKYFGSFDEIEETFVQTGLVTGNLANFLRTTASFVHQILVHLDPHRYTLPHIVKGLCRHPKLTVALAFAFEQKFHPITHDLTVFTETQRAFLDLVQKLDTGNREQDELARHVLLQAMNFVEHILKCNFYRKNKSSFSFRLDPHYLEHLPFERKRLFPELPFAIFFVKGMHFLAFHIRFQDLARGGLRTIYAIKEQMLREQDNLFVECYNLALTQHKKNKDIPEGGAKGVIFLKPYAHLVQESEIYKNEWERASLSKEEIEAKITLFQIEQKKEYLYQTQRSFIDSLLVLINCNEDGTLRAQRIVDYYKKPEYIYLGPDENMHDVMIEWIAAKSISVGYRPLGAFISSKPSCGINHKEYGVTSAGVNVYMEEVLHYLKINPHKERFTVKMTGGPDGDVAGNQIYNLYRYYPHTAKLLAITDVSGTIYDPEGLDLEILTALFKKQQPLRFYPPDMLHRGGFLLDLEKRRDPTPFSQETLCLRKQEEGLFSDWLSGSAMHFLFRNHVHQTKVDLFLPCGGRPKTLNERNYKDFLDENGVPTAKAIVEGANLYLSPEARHHLEKLGVLIIKDSSANKGGVICSSFEVVAGLVLSDEEFMENKTTLVAEILSRVQQLAQKEAHLLLKTHQQGKKSLCTISDEISKRILFFTKQLLEFFSSTELSGHAKDPLIRSFLDYCPPLLRTNFESRLLSNVPENHKKAIIASHIASTLVYERGLDWFPSIVDVLPLLI